MQKKKRFSALPLVNDAVLMVRTDSGVQISSVNGHEIF
jgi:hypothetical protein